MIANYTQQGWELITQRAHGILAAQVALHWKAAERPERWMETLLAIAEHDDAMIELDGEQLLTEAGGPINFTMKHFELEHCIRLSRFTRSKSRYIALLTSMHMDFVYRNDMEADPKAKAFLLEQRELQSVWRKDLGLSVEQTERIYAFMEWCDAFSLLLCQHAVQPESRAIEISRGPDKKKYELCQVGEGELTLLPWPFEANRFDVYFESRIVPQLQFKNSDELRQAFLAAPVKETRWALVNTKPATPKPKVKAK
jgi:hypothetical protein